MSILNTSHFYRHPSEYHKFALVLAFAVDEVNRNTDFLPNKSLVLDFQLYDFLTESYMSNLFEYIDENDENLIPNYVCVERNICDVMLTGPSWKVSSLYAKFLDVYYHKQVRLYGVGLQEI